MATYLLTNQVSLANAAGFPAQAAGNGLYTIQVDVDFGALKNITAASAQVLGSASTASVAILAADTLKIANVPAGCAIKAVYLNVVTGMTGTGASSPTCAVGVAGNNCIALASLSSAAIFSNTGTAMQGGTDTGCIKKPVAVTSDGTIDLTFGGTLATAAPFGKIRVTVELIRL